MFTARGDCARFRASSTIPSAPARPLLADQHPAGIPVNMGRGEVNRSGSCRTQVRVLSPGHVAYTSTRPCKSAASTMTNRRATIRTVDRAGLADTNQLARPRTGRPPGAAGAGGAGASTGRRSCHDPGHTRAAAGGGRLRRCCPPAREGRASGHWVRRKPEVLPPVGQLRRCRGRCMSRRRCCRRSGRSRGAAARAAGAGDPAGAVEGNGTGTRPSGNGHRRCRRTGVSGRLVIDLDGGEA